MATVEAMRHLAVLGLGPGASMAAVREAYRDLVAVWHPDRFAHNPRLAAKAQERLKEINVAHAWLRAHPESLGQTAPGDARFVRPDAPPQRTWSPPPAPPRRWRRAAVVLTIAVAIGAAVVMGRHMSRRGRSRPPVAAANAEELASIAVPPGWPWRGLDVPSASDAGPDDVRALRQRLGPRFNLVRLVLTRPATGKKALGPDAAWNALLAWTNAMLDACRDTGVVAIVTLDAGAFGADARPGTAAWWASPERLTAIVAKSESLATNLARRGPELGAYEVLPKPFVLADGVPRIPDAWPQLRIDVVTAIRRHDPERWIAVTPGPAGTPGTYKGFSPLPFERILYTVDVNAPVGFTRQGLGSRTAAVRYPGDVDGRRWDADALARTLHDVERFELTYRVPILVDEFGVVVWAPGAERYLADLVQAFEDRRFGWAYFGYKGAAAWNPDSDDPPAGGSSAGGSRRWRALEDLFGAARG